MGEIIHRGIVERTAGGDLQVQMTDGLECESCTIKGACHIGESRDTSIRISDAHMDFREGEEVTVHLSTQLAFRALFWAYIFPFIIMVGGLVILSIYLTEAMAGLVSIGFLAIYYLVIYLSKSYFDREFSLKINRLKND